MATTRRTSVRHKAPVRWAIVTLSFLATACAYQAIVTGPPPAHAAPPPAQVVAQSAPTLDEMISQIQTQSSDDGGNVNGSSAGPTFRTRGS
ncbi:MAG: hypothetical protein ACRDIY_15885 [Chloroflexota bacterium]